MDTKINGNMEIRLNIAYKYLNDTNILKIKN